MIRRRAHGFTLLEALVTLVIVSMLVAALMQALTQALSMRTALIRYQRETRLGALQEMWFRDSVGAAVADIPGAFGPLRGTPQGFELLTLAPLAGDGIVRATWRFERVEGGQQLRYEDPRNGEVLVLDGPLTDARFNYLDSDGRWQSQWAPGPDGEAIPRAVRLQAHSSTREIEWTAAIYARSRPPDMLRAQADDARGF